MSEQLYIVATITPKEEHYDQALEGLQKLASEVEKNEQGALTYQVFANKTDGNIIVYERYADKAAIAAHSQTPYYQEFMKAGADMLAMPPRIVILSSPTGFNRS